MSPFPNIFVQSFYSVLFDYTTRENVNNLFHYTISLLLFVEKIKENFVWVFFSVLKVKQRNWLVLFHISFFFAGKVPTQTFVYSLVILLLFVDCFKIQSICECT